MKLLEKNPLFFAFFFPAVADGILTLLGQDFSYWAGEAANEASPAYYVLNASPWLFAAGSVLWLSFWYWIFKRLKEPLALFLAIFFNIAHGWGSSSWIWKMMWENQFYNPANQASVMKAWGIMLAYFAIIAIFAAYCIRVYFKKSASLASN